MYLRGFSGTGEKISANKDRFCYNYKEKKIVNGKAFYLFNWSFDKQHGYMSITIRVSDNKLSNSSLIDTDIDSPYKFDRPLGLYNDGTLLAVFYAVLRRINIIPTGVYAEW